MAPPDNLGSVTTDVFTRSANGKTASSYTTDGRWNIGGWSTYPSRDAIAISTGSRKASDAAHYVPPSNPQVPPQNPPTQMGRPAR
ncbi:MAG: hypothetical protein JOZ24_13535 [Candidatus Eremiobacteraeota bacterium]|nr:hypothetical protein [Candidatus Eremiobacteraeota bacterium]